MKKIALSVGCALVLCLSACSRQQSDWQKAREANTTDSYEQYIKKYPGGEFTAQAQARAKELYEEHDWQKARDTDTPEAYQAFMKQYPEGKWTEEARIRVENFTLAQASAGSNPPAPGADASSPPPSGAPASPPIAHAPPPAAAAVSRSAPALPTSAATGHGKYGVQLGAYKTGAAAAKKRWAHLQKEYPTLLSGLKTRVVARRTATGNVYRLQAVGLSEKRARAVCAGLKAQAQPCLLVPPQNS